MENDPIPPVSPVPAVQIDEKEARTWAMVCHLAGLAGFTAIPFAGIIAPLIVWHIKRDQHAFIDANGKEAVNFQLSILIYTIVSCLLIFVLIGFVLLPLLFLFDLIVVIIAGLKASNGESYRYPLTIRFLN